jgi:hypothetical protein
MATKNLRPEEIFGEARLLVRVMAADRPTVKSGVVLMLTMLFIHSVLLDRHSDEPVVGLRGEGRS